MMKVVAEIVEPVKICILKIVVVVVDATFNDAIFRLFFKLRCFVSAILYQQFCIRIASIIYLETCFLEE